MDSARQELKSESQESLYEKWEKRKCFACKMGLPWPCRCNVRIPRSCQHHHADNNRAYDENGICLTCGANVMWFIDWGNVGG